MQKKIAMKMFAHIHASLCRVRFLEKSFLGQRVHKTQISIVNVPAGKSIPQTFIFIECFL